jgi:hypothetical protein
LIVVVELSKVRHGAVGSILLDAWNMSHHYLTGIQQAIEWVASIGSCVVPHDHHYTYAISYVVCPMAVLEVVDAPNSDHNGKIHLFAHSGDVALWVPSLNL